MRRDEGQKYAIYRQTDEDCTCAYPHLQRWIYMHKEHLGRTIISLDPLFPRNNETITIISFGELIIQQAVMNSVNQRVSD